MVSIIIVGLTKVISILTIDSPSLPDNLYTFTSGFRDIWPVSSLKNDNTHTDESIQVESAALSTGFGYFDIFCNMCLHVVRPVIMTKVNSSFNDYRHAKLIDQLCWYVVNHYPLAPYTTTS